MKSKYIKNGLVKVSAAIVLAAALMMSGCGSEPEASDTADVSVSSGEEENTEKEAEKESLKGVGGDIAEGDKSEKDPASGSENTDTDNTDKSGAAVADSPGREQGKPSGSDNSGRGNSSGSNQNGDFDSSKPKPGGSGAGGSNSGGSNGNAGADKPAPHVHRYDTVVKKTPGDCRHESKIVKKCSCGKTITETGAKGKHKWVDQGAMKMDWTYAGQENTGPSSSVETVDHITTCRKCGYFYGKNQDTFMEDYWTHSDKTGHGSYTVVPVDAVYHCLECSGCGIYKRGKLAYYEYTAWKDGIMDSAHTYYKKLTAKQIAELGLPSA